MQREENIIPVLLGADLNCYTVARAFYEAYGAFSYAFGKKRTKNGKKYRFFIPDVLDSGNFGCCRVLCL